MTKTSNKIEELVIISCVTECFGLPEELFDLVEQQWKNWCSLFTCKYSTYKGYTYSSNNDLFTGIHLNSITIPRNIYIKELKNLLSPSFTKRYGIRIKSVEFVENTSHDL